MKKKYETTGQIRRLLTRYNFLDDNLEKILSPPFWKQKISIADKVFYLNRLSEAWGDLIEIIFKEFPELKGKDLSVGKYFIEIK